MNELLKVLAEEDAKTVVPVQIEAAVMRAWDESGVPATFGRKAPERARRWSAALAWSAASLCAAVLIAAAVLVSDRTSRAPLPAAVESPGPLRTGAADSPVDVVTGAEPPRDGVTYQEHPLAIDYALVADPFARPEALSIVRARMSRSMLGALGLPVGTPDAAGMVEVGIVVGEDGVARAIRGAAIVPSVEIEE